MKKMKLSLDDLKVESVQTTPESNAPAEGTVFGYISCDQTWCKECPPGGCPSQVNTCQSTCGSSCNGTCTESCNGTCDNSCNGGCGGQTCPEICGTFACWRCTDYGGC